MRALDIIICLYEAYGFSLQTLSSAQQKKVLDDLDMIVDYAEGGSYKTHLDYAKILQAFVSLGHLSGHLPQETHGVRGWLGRRNESITSFLGRYVVRNEPYVIQRPFLSYTIGKDVSSFAKRLEEVNTNTIEGGTEPPVGLMMAGTYVSYNMEDILQWAGKNWQKLANIATKLHHPFIPSVNNKKRNYAKLLPQWGKEEREMIALVSEKELTMAKDGHPLFPVLFVLGKFLSATSEAGHYIKKQGKAITPTVYGVSLEVAKRVYTLLRREHQR